MRGSWDSSTNTQRITALLSVTRMWHWKFVAAFDSFTFVSFENSLTHVSNSNPALLISLTGSSSARVCDEVEDWKCFSNIESTLIDEESQTFKSCGCLESCNTIEYTVDRLSSYISHSYNGSFYRGLGTFRFASDEFIARKRTASYGMVGLLSNIGGILGLFLGMSVLSVVEAFYFFVIRFISDLWWKEH